METLTKLPLLDLKPDTDNFREEVLEGLQQTPQKTLPCKFLYDERGSKLFEQICELEEYYPTRTEMAIMRQHIDAIVEAIGPNALLIEYGSGSSHKTRVLLDHLPTPAAYVPIDISREHLCQSAEELAARYGDLTVRPVCADYTVDFALPEVEKPVGRTVVYFPGSTIGNMEPDAAVALMQGIAEQVGSGGGLAIGVDLKKEVPRMEAAYNDAKGVTHAFNKNLLRRINRELGADFNLDQFVHRATYNADQGRIESHLVSLADQRVRVDGVAVTFDEQETIHTENSYKYEPKEFAELADQAGFSVERVWTDDDHLFSVQFLEAK